MPAPEDAPVPDACSWGLARRGRRSVSSPRVGTGLRSRPRREPGDLHCFRRPGPEAPDALPSVDGLLPSPCRSRRPALDGSARRWRPCCPLVAPRRPRPSAPRCRSCRVGPAALVPWGSLLDRWPHRPASVGRPSGAVWLPLPADLSVTLPLPSAFVMTVPLFRCHLLCSVDYLVFRIRLRGCCSRSGGDAGPGDVIGCGLRIVVGRDRRNRYRMSLWCRLELCFLVNSRRWVTLVIVDQ